VFLSKFLLGHGRGLCALGLGAGTHQCHSLQVARLGLGGMCVDPAARAPLGHQAELDTLPKPNTLSYWIRVRMEI
jgi:hypothetical protein